MTTAERERLTTTLQAGRNAWTPQRVYLADAIAIASNLGLHPDELRIIPGGAVITGFAIEKASDG